MRSKVKKGYLRLTHINKSYKNVAVLKNLSLTIQEGEFIAIVGKSGCGKSTLLRLLSGLEKPDSGAIEISGNKLEKLNHESRLMFQDGRLLPWKTVGENVALGLTRESSKEVKEVLRSVDLDNRIHEWPEKLSGGQKQRVALARALIHKPRLLLLDEPLGALDALTRLDMQGLIEQIWLQKKFTALLVTHDVEEAVSLADRVIILKDGNTWRNRNSCTYYFKIKKNPPRETIIFNKWGNFYHYFLYY
ncbi:ABC transporter ATP-binding protein [Heyndrickxia sporothermodurans]|uniref:ATP-binding cassette domain-containing protein n=1 Tax=Heyndrickxia sporothermodurans TaxID=46224 RepID=A0AB37H7E5_9BACI|nr:ATP-binding cassette domain-containing protein [Heyndrickxia sporothermodurans]MBL5768724.1 ATP-binding cassette domain-containing protein [Heyndrickxia sporothermodurans]MBL5772442.1 ATP-binding cassette domain-containing protein [Heyndrickxia sporothermodurans]MBL5776139.1 ATP-binding cassette domain-containing protein [Heyndrickxia sporothermodurans]MBL5779838.1 ATP-binding cassette domain-containing protein [Heyndrickxia sporothermodurans]MBL5783233.1 ATP-binding cassette domain-contain